MAALPLVPSRMYLSAFGRPEIRSNEAKPGCAALDVPMRGMDQARVPVMRETRPCIEQRRETFDGERLVAVLRPPVSRGRGEARRPMDGAHRAFGLVLMLAAGPARPKAFETDVGAGRRGCAVGYGLRKHDNADEPVFSRVTGPQGAPVDPENGSRGPSPREVGSGLTVEHDDCGSRTCPSA